MRFENVGTATVAFVGVCGLVMLRAATAAAHQGHVVGTGLATSVVHALEHGLGALVIAAAGVALLRRHRPAWRRTRTLVRDRKVL